MPRKLGTRGAFFAAAWASRRIVVGIFEDVDSVGCQRNVGEIVGGVGSGRDERGRLLIGQIVRHIEQAQRFGGDGAEHRPGRRRRRIPIRRGFR